MVILEVPDTDGPVTLQAVGLALGAAALLGANLPLVLLDHDQVVNPVKPQLAVSRPGDLPSTSTSSGIGWISPEGDTHNLSFESRKESFPPDFLYNCQAF